MEELSVTGIVLNSIPYKDKDRIVHIFSVELGNISAIIKGVSNANAKNKFACQPFCFARFDLTKSHEFFVVKTVDLIDSFFDITQDYDNFSYCSAMLEICNFIMKPNIISESLFLSLIKSLQNVVYNNVDIKVVSIRFFSSLLELVGYKLNFETCDYCDMKFMGDIKFNFSSGTFRCAHCTTDGASVISKQDFMNLRIISSTPIDKLGTLKLNETSISNCLNLLLKNISIRLSYKFKAVEF